MAFNLLFFYFWLNLTLVFNYVFLNCDNFYFHMKTKNKIRKKKYFTSFLLQTKFLQLNQIEFRFYCFFSTRHLKKKLEIKNTNFYLCAKGFVFRQYLLV